MVRDVFAALFGGHRTARSWMGWAVLGWALELHFTAKINGGVREDQGVRYVWRHVWWASGQRRRIYTQGITCIGFHGVLLSVVFISCHTKGRLEYISYLPSPLTWQILLFPTSLDSG